MPYPERVRIVEVGPRDGLQNEATPISTEAKVELIDHLSASGLTHIEVTAFVNPARLAQIAMRLLGLGCYQVSLGDTTGLGNPVQVAETVEMLRGAGAREEQIALHLHDTRGTGLANALAGLSAGVSTFDSSLGGLGGTPYAPGANGNLATEELVFMLEEMGVSTSVDLETILQAAEGVARVLGKELPSRYLKATRATGAREAGEASA